jgi:hypothetical protein
MIELLIVDEVDFTFGEDSKHKPEYIGKIVTAKNDRSNNTWPYYFQENGLCYYSIPWELADRITSPAPASPQMPQPSSQQNLIGSIGAKPAKIEITF